MLLNFLRLLIHISTAKWFKSNAVSSILSNEIVWPDIFDYLYLFYTHDLSIASTKTKYIKQNTKTLSLMQVLHSDHTFGKIPCTFKYIVCLVHWKFPNLSSSTSRYKNVPVWFWNQNLVRPRSWRFTVAIPCLYSGNADW